MRVSRVHDAREAKSSFGDDRGKRDGRAYYYLRRPGFPNVRLAGLPWSPRFMAAYEAAMSASLLRGHSASLETAIRRGLDRCRPTNIPLGATHGATVGEDSEATAVHDIIMCAQVAPSYALEAGADLR